MEVSLDESDIKPVGLENVDVNVLRQRASKSQSTKTEATKSHSTKTDVTKDDLKIDTDDEDASQEVTFKSRHSEDWRRSDYWTPEI